MKFDHHPDPAIGFCIEVEEITAMTYNRHVGFDPEPALDARIERAMMFRVGGDLNCIDAKAKLREVEKNVYDDNTVRRFMSGPDWRQR